MDTQPFTALIGDFNEPIISLFSRLIEKVIGEDRELRVYSSHWANEIMNCLNLHTFDGKTPR